ncbi:MULTISPECIES: hypothetical protein [Dehalococcoides]|uniref:hypothetical protein n=1 Tax=Dehalococcoides TaxID=61434 RepID=UPI0012E0340C|nr:MULTISPECIES: hypothetical protein [Dehalococcoides]QYY58599.2 hypothetical protein CWV2_000530 [Dehalococcoides mccartyi]
MDLPPEIIRAQIKQGAVYLFPIDEFPEKSHYCIILNKNPLSDPILIYVYITKNVSRVVSCNNNSRDTLVFIGPEEYPILKFPSIIDCNELHTITLQDLITKNSKNELRIIEEISEYIWNKIANGVLASKRIESIYKKLI